MIINNNVLLIQSGGDVCGYNEEEFDSDLCENWIKAGSMLPLMKINFNSDSEDDVIKNIVKH